MIKLPTISYKGIMNSFICNLLHKSVVYLRTIRPVSPEEFKEKTVNMLFAANDYLGTIALPLTIVVLCAGLLIFIGSSFIHSGTGKKVGLASMFMALFGLFIFYVVPTLVGVIQYIGNVMNN